MALSRQETEILAQDQSTGILYQGYDHEFHLCIFEEAGVQGRNERYEFRCDTSLECCGRVCCIPEPEMIPWWLWLLFLALFLLLLAALLTLLWYLCARRKRRQKKDMHSGYRTIRQADDDGLQRGFRFGDGNNHYDEATDSKRLVGAQPPRRSSFHEEEMFEESFKEEIEYGDGSSLGSELEDVEVERMDRTERGSHSRGNQDRERDVRPQKFVPSPLQETLLERPQSFRVVEHDDALSRGSIAPEPVDITSPEPVRAQHAVYRPFVPDPLDETDFIPANRLRTSTHDLSESLTPRRPTISTLEVPETQKAVTITVRPGFDNAPSY
ncbi:hypothetical protein M3Y96_00255100 [Aphelenchoides besseyi]|nr:hypothetical protein M3Y96_00255100 [Aphelenchoides besseyi]